MGDFRELGPGSAGDPGKGALHGVLRMVVCEAWKCGRKRERRQFILDSGVGRGQPGRRCPGAQLRAREGLSGVLLSPLPSDLGEPQCPYWESEVIVHISKGILIIR